MYPHPRCQSDVCSLMNRVMRERLVCCHSCLTLIRGTLWFSSLNFIWCAVSERPRLPLPLLSCVHSSSCVTLLKCPLLSLCTPPTPHRPLPLCCVRCPSPLLLMSVAPRTLLPWTVAAVTITPVPLTVPPSSHCALPALLHRCCLHILTSSCLGLYHRIFFCFLPIFFVFHSSESPVMLHLCFKPSLNYVFLCCCFCCVFYRHL